MRIRTDHNQEKEGKRSIWTQSETLQEKDDTNDPDNVPMSETPMNDCRDASHIKSKSSWDDAFGERQRLKFDGEACPDPKRSKVTVKKGETRESNSLPGESLERKRYDSCQILEMAAPQLSRWKNWLRTIGQMSVAKVRCLMDSIARWNQIRI